VCVGVYECARACVCAKLRTSEPHNTALNRGLEEGKWKNACVREVFLKESAKFSKNSPMIPQKSTTWPQKSHHFPKKSPIFVRGRQMESV